MDDLESLSLLTGVSLKSWTKYKQNNESNIFSLNIYTQKHLFASFAKRLENRGIDMTGFGLR